MIIGLNESVNVTQTVMIEHSNRDGDLTVAIPGPQTTVTKDVIPRTPTITSRTVTIAVYSTVTCIVNAYAWFAGGTRSTLTTDGVAAGATKILTIASALEFTTVDIVNDEAGNVSGFATVTVIGRS